MTKANLIFVHSFPTNSKARNGLIGYLNLFFQVIPVDLPGFIKNIPAIEPASLKDYSCYVDAVVTKLKLENFYMGGASFGFKVVNDCESAKKCSGIIGIFPYLNKESLSINQFKQFGILGLCKIVRLLHIEKYVLREKLVIKFGFFAKHSQTTRDAIFKEISPKTFFAVLELILTDHSRPKFHKVPYLILLNPNDNRINHSYIESCLTKEKVKYQILTTSLEHFPKQLDSVTLGKSIDHNSITKALDFLFNQKRG